MQFVLIILGLLALASLIGWFNFSSSIFITLRKRDKSLLHKVLLVLSYAYPFILAFSVYSSWECYENGDDLKAIYFSIFPLIVFCMGWIAAKYLSKK